MEPRERGWSVSAAAGKVGVSGSTGNNWTHGYTTYRRGAVVGVVAPLDRLAVREISGRFLSQDVRFEIACLRRAGLSVREVARRLDRAPSTLSRELRRNALRGGYRPFEAYRRATLRRGREHPGRLDTNPELRGRVGELLGRRWSPQEIGRHPNRRFCDDASMRLCQESIY
jgi:IS30 family transposase